MTLHKAVQARLRLCLLWFAAAAACAGPNQLAARAPRIDFAKLGPSSDSSDAQHQLQRLASPPYVVKFAAGASYLASIGRQLQALRPGLPAPDGEPKPRFLRPDPR